MKIANFKWGCGNFRILVLDELHSATFVKKMNLDPRNIFRKYASLDNLYFTVIENNSKKIIRNVP